MLGFCRKKCIILFSLSLVTTPFRSTNMKFFNNTVEPINSEEDKIESLKGIADSVAVAMEAIGLVPDLWFGPLEKKKSKPLDPNTGKRFCLYGFMTEFLIFSIVTTNIFSKGYSTEVNEWLSNLLTSKYFFVYIYS